MIVKNLLTDENLTVFLNAIENPEHWSTKQLTGNLEDNNFKRNKEYINENKGYLDQILIESLNDNIPWREYVVAPKITSEILYLKYEENSVYKYHADVSKGSLSSFTYANTLFLSDPDDYEGGELILSINNEEIPYKLEKNSLLTYPVGVKHEVKKITKGVRCVAVFWTESWITDEADRALLRELGEIYNDLGEVSRKLFKDTKISENPLNKSLVDLIRLSEAIHNRYPRWRDPRCILVTE